jgi:hypothetical protein|nr:MAG TPA: hypothetical protein [Caudoviricetes sp.]
MINALSLSIGYALMAIGGFALFVIMSAFFIEIACELWVLANTKLRAVWKAESLVYEYNKNREKFLEWLAKGDEK